MRVLEQIGRFLAGKTVCVSGCHPAEDMARMETAQSESGDE
jgi:hypothetical protein